MTVSVLWKSHVCTLMEKPYKTVGKKGVTSFASMVAPPEARLKTFVFVTLYVPPKNCTQFCPFEDV